MNGGGKGETRGCEGRGKVRSGRMELGFPTQSDPFPVSAPSVFTPLPDCLPLTSDFPPLMSACLLPPCPSPQPQAIGFSLVPYMPSVWSLTTLYFIICFSYNFTNSAVFTSLGWMFPKRAGGALNLVSEGGGTAGTKGGGRGGEDSWEGDRGRALGGVYVYCWAGCFPSGQGGH